MLPIIFYILFSSFITYFVFGFYILFKNRHSLTNRIFFSLCINLSFWALGYAFMSIAPNQEVANFWRLIAASGWCLVYSTWLDFAILVRRESKKWMTDIRRLFIYLPSALFFIGNLSYKPGKTMEKFKFVWREIDLIDYFESLYTIYAITFAAVGILIIYKWGKNSVSKREKKQANIIVITALISFLMTTLSGTILLPFLDIDVFPIGIIMFSIVLLGIRHAITKYKMMSLSSQVASDYILRTMNDPVILIGNDLLIKEVNNAALDFTGFTEEEIKEFPISLFIEDTVINQAAIQKLVKTGAIKNLEVGLLTKSKKSIPCLLSGSSITNELDEILGMACVFHDITDRKNAEKILLKAHQELEIKVRARTEELEYMNTLLEEEVFERRRAEESLKSSEEKFRALMKQSSDGILVVDQDSRKVVESNNKANHILEFIEGKISGLNAEQLIPIYKEEINEAIDKIIKKENIAIKEIIKYIRRDGTNRDLEISTTLVGYSNKKFIMVTLRDITEKLRMEERKQQVVKMESLGTLAGGIAHDFNNILAGIMGYTQLTLEEMAGEELLEEYLLEVLKLGERAKKLISQILTFSKKTIIKPDIIDLRHIIEDVLKMIKITLPAHITIQCSLGCNDAYVFADQGELHQLIMNLCVNAELAMYTDGGVLEISIKAIVVEREIEIVYQVLKPGKYIELKVIDSGCGMEESIKKRIFEPFFTTREVQGGTGLGLSVVHGIVSRCEGVIMVDSELNKGSTFTILLPSCQNNLQNLNLSNETESNSIASILFVDDEESIVKTVQRLLKREGYHVIGVLDPREALKLFKENTEGFDIVVTDQSMPDMTGESLVKEMRMIRPELPAVICSGYSHEDNYEKDNSKHITEFLLKPISKMQYMSAIEKLLKDKRL